MRLGCRHRLLHRRMATLDRLAPNERRPVAPVRVVAHHLGDQEPPVVPQPRPPLTTRTEPPLHDRRGYAA